MQQAIADQNCSVLPSGTISQTELIRICPKKFYEKNEWSSFINIIKYRDGYDQNKWNWISPEKMVQREQFSYLLGLINSDKILNQYKLAAAGWYLSQILHTVPQYGD